MKNASSRRGVLPVPEPGPVCRRRLRSEPSPTLAGLPGHPWRPPYRTQDEILARPVPSSIVRRAHDPLGRGWVRRKPAAASPVVSRPSKPEGRVRRAVVRGTVASVSAVGTGASGPAASSEETLSSAPAAVEAGLPTTDGAPPERAASKDAPAWAAPVVARARARRIELIPSAPSLPRILFTGDAPPPGFEVSGTPANAPVDLELPSADTGGATRAKGVAETSGAGTARLTDAPGEVWLTARDPFTVVAHWEREIPEPEAPEREWGRGRWWMRLHEGTADGPVVTERPATESAGTVLLPVIQSGQKYVAELGYDSHRSGWHGVAISHPVPTPPDRPSVVPEVPAKIQWGTVAPWEGEPGLGHSVGYVPVPAPAPRIPASASGGGPEVRLEEIWIEEYPEVQEADRGGALRWSWALWSGGGIESSGELVADSPDAVDAGVRKGRRIRKESVGQVAPGLAEDEDGLASSAELTSAPAAEGRRSFWFRVNAEVILHGSTEPDAQVTIAGRPVALRPDGSFSFRFAFPDGDFRLPVEAVSADRMDGRKAAVRFLRATMLEGEVGVHPVPPAWDAALEEWGS